MAEKKNKSQKSTKTKDYSFSVHERRPPKHYDIFVEFMRSAPRPCQYELAQKYNLSEGTLSKAFKASAEYHALLSMVEKSDYHLVDREFLKQWYGEDKLQALLLKRIEELTLTIEELRLAGVAEGTLSMFKRLADPETGTEEKLEILKIMDK
jgi:hypothetical protein